jgi:PAS domain S-box-containing protein
MSEAVPEYPGGPLVLRGGGDMGARMRGLDWSATPLGPPARWPHGLATMVRVLLASPQPMALWWGDALIELHNDAYRAVLGERDRDALGRPAAEVWQGDWHRLGPRAARVLAGGLDGDAVAGGATMTLTAVPGDGGRPAGLLIVAQLPAAAAHQDAVPEAIVDGAEAPAAAGVDDGADCFRHLADHAPVMVRVTDPAGRCTFVSKTWYELTGQPPGAGLGDGWLDAVHPCDRTGVHAAVVAAHTRQRPFRIEYRFRRPDGDERWVIDEAAPRFSPAGAYVGHLGSVIDITDHKRAEQALDESDRRKDEFLATLAHELRNPLAPIRSALDVMAIADGDRNLAERARVVMERQLRHLVRLVDDLLDVSRLSRGKIELRKERSDLAAVLRAAIETTAPRIDELGHRLKVVTPPETLAAEIDPTRLTQVVANLLDNAATYMERGGDIRLALTRDGDDAVISVRDRGLGIPPELQASVFDMFTQLHRGPGTARGGLGLGLAIVQRLVALHGGTVDVFSDGPGRGSEFVVRIPIAPVGELWVAETAPVEVAPRRRVLIADDNEEAVEILAGLLELMGNDVQIAHDGAEAVDVAAQFRPEVIFLDLGMPRMDGLEACRRIRQEPWGEDAVIAALTGWGHEDDKRRTHEAGFDRHLVKPVGRAAIEELLAARHART